MTPTVGQATALVAQALGILQDRFAFPRDQIDDILANEITRLALASVPRGCKNPLKWAKHMESLAFGVITHHLGLTDSYAAIWLELGGKCS